MRKEFRITLFNSDIHASELALLAALENGKKKGLKLMDIAIYFNILHNRKPELEKYSLTCLNNILLLDYTNQGVTTCLLTIEEVEVYALYNPETDYELSESKVDVHGNIRTEPLADHD